MTDLAAISRPYAKAAFEVAQAAGQAPQWSDHLALAAAVIEHPTMATLLGNPQVEREALLDVLRAAGKDQFSAEFDNLLRLMSQNRRLAVLPQVRDSFNSLRAEAEQRLPVNVRSATELSAEQRGKLEASLEQRFGRTIEAAYSIDPELIGGAVIEAGDVFIDGSLSNKLQRLRGALHKS
ncbi:MAG: F0F1 ATP synthase subunit delta [Wenzhouxiangellaceae bacterium]